MKYPNKEVRPPNRRLVEEALERSRARERHTAGLEADVRRFMTWYEDDPSLVGQALTARSTSGAFSRDDLHYAYGYIAKHCGVTVAERALGIDELPSTREIANTIVRDCRRSPSRRAALAQTETTARPSFVDETLRTLAQLVESPGGGPDSQPVPSRVRSAARVELADPLDDVRLHDGPVAAQLADALDADALTLGRDIFFAEGKLDASRPEGAELMAHELAHAAGGNKAATAAGALSVGPPKSHEELFAETSAGMIARGLFEDQHNAQKPASDLTPHARSPSLSTSTVHLSRKQRTSSVRPKIPGVWRVERSRGIYGAQNLPLGESRVAEIFFPTGKADLDAEDMTVLDDALTVIKHLYPAPAQIITVGSVDGVGHQHEGRQRALAQRRAKVVGQYLAQGLRAEEKAFESDPERAKKRYPVLRGRIPAPPNEPDHVHTNKWFGRVEIGKGGQVVGSDHNLKSAKSRMSSNTQLADKVTWVDADHPGYEKGKDEDTARSTRIYVVRKEVLDKEKKGFETKKRTKALDKIARRKLEILAVVEGFINSRRNAIPDKERDEAKLLIARLGDGAPLRPEQVDRIIDILIGEPGRNELDPTDVADPNDNDSTIIKTLLDKADPLLGPKQRSRLKALMARHVAAREQAAKNRAYSKTLAEVVHTKLVVLLAKKSKNEDQNIFLPIDEPYRTEIEGNLVGGWWIEADDSLHQFMVDKLLKHGQSEVWPDTGKRRLAEALLKARRDYLEEISRKMDTDDRRGKNRKAIVALRSHQSLNKKSLKKRIDYVKVKLGEAK